MFRTVSSLAVAAACLMLAASSLAAEQADSGHHAKFRNTPPTPTESDKCESLVKQFKMQNVGHVDRATLETARRKLYYGEQKCKNDPKNGIKSINEAFGDINVKPRR